MGQSVGEAALQHYDSSIEELIEFYLLQLI